MPAVSKSQQQAAAIALSAKRGGIDSHDLFGAAEKMYNSMETSDLEDFASTKHMGLPDKVKEDKLREYIRTYIKEIIKETELNEDVVKEGIINKLTWHDMQVFKPNEVLVDKINEIVDIVNDMQGIA